MLPRRIPFNQIAFATLLGVGGGLYIYKPMFEQSRRTTRPPNKQDTKTEAEHNEQHGDGRESFAK